MTDTERYMKAAHAVQSGVAATMNYEPKEIDPKHLRVGVNMAMVEHSALVKLLVAKGIITSQEYDAALADATEAEQKRYEDLLSKRFGRKVTLA